MIHGTSVYVIAASVRPQRISRDIADWVAALARDHLPGAAVELIDLRDWPLPMDAEPELPAAGRPYRRDVTMAWSRKIAAGRAFVFVTPQYNWGYPAVLKNALDHLFHEWAGKAAMIVSYGGHGGGRCAEQLRQVLGALDLRTVETAPALPLSRPLIEANAGAIDAGKVFGAHAPVLAQGFAELEAALAKAGA